MRSSARVFLWAVVACLLAGVAPVLAATDYTAIGANPGQDLGLTVVRNEDGTVRKLVNSVRLPREGNPSAIASEFLNQNALTLFGIAPSTDKAGATSFGDVTLVDVRTSTSRSGHHVWQQAMVNGVPVHNGYVVTHLTLDGVVLFATSDIGSVEFDLSADKASIDRTAALNRALGLIGGDGMTRVDPKADLVVLRDDNGDHLAWRTETATYNPYGDWQIFIDAATSAPLLTRDLLVCVKPEEKPASITPPVANEISPYRTAEGLNKSALVSGSGSVFIANPLNNHPERYPWREFEPLLTGVTDPVTLTNLDGSGLLTGPWVDVFNSTSARANEPSLVYNYTPTIVAGHFQEVNVYYHINEFQEYFQNTLGIANARARVTNCFAHQGTDDNSDYSPSQDRIRYGDGGVDDSDDGEIVLHEYGHAVHNDIVPGFVYAGESGAISEGFGDYFGATYGDNALVGEWDGVSYNPGPPPFLRRTDTDKHYPEDIVNQVHSDGEIISAAWWDFRNLVGAQIADQIIIEGMFYTGTSATFQDYADGMVAADQALHGGSHVGYIFQAFGGRGIGATYLLNFNHVVLGDTEDTAGPYPVVATITHTSPISAPDAVTLYWRLAGGGAWTAQTMVPTGNFDEWAGQIPGPGSNTAVDYYLSVTDDSAISGSAPTGAPATFYSFIVGPDTQFPVIGHTPVLNQPLQIWPASVNATITDNGAIAAAFVSYSLNGAPQADLPLASLGGGQYSVAFPEAAGSLVIGDVFEYSITATDGSSSANTTVDGPHTFSIIDALGVVLILDDDSLAKSEVKYDDNKQPLPEHVRDLQDKGASATSMAAILTTAGWVVVEEAAGVSSPATWSGYSFLVVSSGANTGPLANATFRAAVEAFVVGGGKVLSEGGEVAYDAISSPGYPTYASGVVHGFDWDSDNSGALTVATGMGGHPILTTPHAVAAPLALNYTGYGDQDSYKPNPDAYIVMGTSNYPANAGVMVYDNNPNPASAQIVHYAFNFAALTNAAEGAKLLENTARFLTAPETGGTASMSGDVQVMGAGNGGVLIQANPGGYSTLTNPDGTWMIDNMYGNTYTVTATLAGYGSAPLTVVLADGEQRTGVDFGLAPLLDFVYCVQPDLAIPDNNVTGVSSQILVTDGDVLIDVTADINITHTWKGDLIIELTSPAGTVVRLHNGTGSSTDNVITNYDGVTAVDGPGHMSDFDGESPVGLWTLFVRDKAAGDTGRLVEWCLNVTVSEQVVAAETPVLQVSQAQNGRQLAWDYNPAFGQAFHVYRRVVGESALRLTAQPLSSADGHLVFSDNAAGFAEGTVLYYSLREVRNGAELGFGDEVAVTVKSSLPTVFALHDNYPNPFNPITNIKFDLPKAGRVSLRIFDLSGRLVRTLVDEDLARATHTYQWDGADNGGRRVSSGTYYYRVQTGQTSETGKMMLIK